MVGMDETLWWQHGVVYQIYPRSFQDASGDGVGDLRGILQRLDYMTETLGIDAIWLSPFYPSPMADFGYDVSNYTDVDPLFGTLEDFDALVREAHARGLHVIIDWVPNHSSDQHSWFVESRSSRHNPKRDWFIWADPKPDGSPPNNWIANFGGSAWTFDETTGQYYLHSYLPQQPDLNWRNEGLRAAMFDTVRFWLERGVDGLRIDAAHHILKDALFRDNPPNVEQGGRLHKPLGDYDTQLHVYDQAQPEAHDVYRELRRVLDSYGAERPRAAIGELHLYDLPEWARYYGADLDEMHLPFNFRLLLAPWTAEGVRASVDALEAALPDGAWPNYVLGNHDEGRIASRVGLAQARIAMTLLLTLRGTPTLYYGDELGMRDVAIPPEREQDPWGLRVPGLGLSRDPERTPMQWDDSANAGFSPAGAEPWLPLGDDYAAVNVATERDDPHSMLTLTRRLLALRKDSKALQIGAYRPLDDVPPGCFVYLRETAGQRLLVALNFTAQEQLLRLPGELGDGRIVISTALDREGSVDLAAFSLRGAEGCVIAIQES